jgi:hypothetical protein
LQKAQTNELEVLKWLLIDIFKLKRLWALYLDMRILTGCCPNKNLFERSLKRFLFINLGEVKEKRFQLLEPEGRVLESPGTRLRCIKKCFRASEK